MSYKCTICDKLFANHKGAAMHIVMGHKDKRPVEDFISNSTRKVEAIDVPLKRKYAKRAKATRNTGLAYVDLPITVRVYLSAIGSVAQ